MKRKQVHGAAGMSARTRYQQSWPFAGSADSQSLPHQRFRDAGSRLAPAANAASRRMRNRDATTPVGKGAVV
jgi:hypothetical protein